MRKTVWSERGLEAAEKRSSNFARPWYRCASELLSELDARGKPALDVGCGVGEFLSLLRDRGYDPRGVDGDQHQAARVRALGFSCPVADLELELPFADRTFSLVSCLEVIEHVARAEHLLEEIARVLVPGGHFVVSTPNVAFFSHRVRHLFGDTPPEEGIHLRFFTRSRLEKVLRGAGFEIVRRRSYGVVPGLDRLGLRRRAAIFAAPAAVETLLAYHFVYLAKKV